MHHVKKNQKNLLLVPGRTQYFLVYCVSNHKNGSLSPMTTDSGHTRSSSLWNKSDWTWSCWVIHPQPGTGGITVTLCDRPWWWIAFRLLSWKMSIMVNMQLNCLLCAAHTAKVRGRFHPPLGCSSQALMRSFREPSTWMLTSGFYLQKHQLRATTYETQPTAPSQGL